MEIVSPSGRTYQWDKSTPPTKADIDELQKFDAAQGSGDSPITAHQARADYVIPTGVDAFTEGASSGQPIIGQGENRGSLATIPELPRSMGFVGGGFDAINKLISGFTSPKTIAPTAALLHPATAPYALAYLGGQGLKGTAEETGRLAGLLSVPGANPKELGEAAVSAPLSALMTAGMAKAGAPAEAPRLPEIKDNTITNQINDASSKNGLINANANANKIALTPTEPAKSAKDSARVLSGLLPASSAEISANVFKNPPPEELPSTLGNLIGQDVEYAGHQGQLIRTDDGAFAILKGVTEKGKPNTIEIEGSGKEPTTLAEDVGVKPNLDSLSAKQSNPEIVTKDESPSPVAPDESPENTASLYNDVYKKTDGKWYAQNGKVVKDQFIIDHLDKQMDSQNKALEDRSSSEDGISGVSETPPIKDSNPDSSTGATPILYQWKPWLSRIPVVGKFIKGAFGAVDENVGSISPKTMGAIRSAEYDKSNLRTEWNKDTLPFGQMLRKSVPKELIPDYDLAIQNGDHEWVENNLKKLPNGADLIDAFHKATDRIDQMRELEVASGRDIGQIEGYWPRSVHDYKGLRNELGLAERGALDRAIVDKQKSLGRVLTDDERSDVINQSISNQLKGKPGFLKPRTIDTIQNNFLKYYDPFDVSLENHINRVSSDFITRKYFGKNQASFLDPQDGTIGEILAQEMRDNPSLNQELAVKNAEAKKGSALTKKESQIVTDNAAEAQKVVIDNIKAWSENDKISNHVIAELGRKIGRATNLLHIGDISSGLAQTGDIFLHLDAYGLKATAKGWFDRGSQRINLGDLGVHEGNAETAGLSRSDRNTAGKRFADGVIATTVGLFDRVGKEAGINASRHAFYDAVRDPASKDFIALNRKWSQRFPDRWPEILKDLHSKDFKDGKLNDNTKFFLYNELADLQPISQAQRAQFENAAPSFKFLYTLKRYYIKQLNVLRDRGYEKLKNPDTRLEGAKNLVSYIAIAGGAQAVFLGVLRNALFGRKIDQQEVSDMALSGLTQLAGVTKYNIHSARQDGPTQAAASFLFPLGADLKDAYDDTGLAIKSFRGDMGTPRNPVDFLQQAKTTKDIPLVGREIYNWWGHGKDTELKRQQQSANGTQNASTVQEIGDLIIPPRKKG